MTKVRIRIIFLLTTFMMLAPISAVAVDVASGQDNKQRENYSKREEVRQFAEELAKSEGFTAEGLLYVLGQAEYKQSIIDAISRPAERTLTWSKYQDIFLTSRRISDGQKFMFDNAKALETAYKKYGVPPVIVTAIIGVETMYGRHRGNYRVLDALATLAFDYPPRSKFFKKELKEFILLVREENQDITDLKGSYAGAMGYGQFIPSSYRHYSVDFDGDGVRDIWNNKTDAIGSVANYFARHGWREGEEVVTRINPEVDVEGSIFNVSLKPSSTIGELAELGIIVNMELAGTTKVSPMKLIGKEGDEYWLGLHNFYVITRYNHSKLYAMAIFQLSEALRNANIIASAVIESSQELASN